MNHSEILKISTHYVISMAKSKPFNIQSSAIINFYNNNKTNPYYNSDDYLLDYKDFLLKYPIDITRDLVYKNDSSTTREMYVISPAHYLYYTYLTFVILYNIKSTKNLNFSLHNYKIFYSGHISFEDTDQMSIKKNSNYANSYTKFQNLRTSYLGSKILVMDVQNFFNTIPCDKIISKINKSKKSYNCQNSIKNLNDFFTLNKFNSLPQFHYSIASSSLSQFYLCDFSEKMSQLLQDENCEEAIRFVDDIYIKLQKRKHTKTINRMLNKITFYLWKEGLNLNHNKTKILSAKEYKKLVETNLEVSSIPEKSLVSKNIENQITNKVDDLLKNNAYKLRSFFKSLNALQNKKGIDIKGYHLLLNKYIAIDGEHVSKVLNSLIYSKKWKSVNILYLDEIVNTYDYIIFNPALFTVFYIMISKHIELYSRKKLNYHSNLIQSLEKVKEHSFRDSIVTINVFIQNGYINDKLLGKLKIVNKDYVDFIKNYIK